MSFWDIWNKGCILAQIEGQDLPAWQLALIMGGGILVFAILIPYLLGSLNSAVIFSRLLYHDDIRRYGSGNAGMTNMLRTYGKGAAGLTLLGDLFKTWAGVAVASLTMGAHLGGWIAALFCMAGHVFPVFYRFKGGKGVLCAAAALLMLCPFAFACSFLTFVIFVAFTKYVSLGSLMGSLMLPLYVNAYNEIFKNIYPTGGINGLIAVLMALFIIWCHRENIRRIMAGKESKLSFGKGKKVPKEDGDEKKQDDPAEDDHE